MMLQTIGVGGGEEPAETTVGGWDSGSATATAETDWSSVSRKKLVNRNKEPEGGW